MFKDGSSVKQIAKSRNLAASTIESHLAQFVDSGELELDQLIDMDKLFAIKTILLKHPGISLADVRNKLGEDYTYWEVRLVMGSYSNT